MNNNNFIIWKILKYEFRFIWSVGKKKNITYIYFKMPNTMLIFLIWNILKKCTAFCIIFQKVFCNSFFGLSALSKIVVDISGEKNFTSVFFHFRFPYMLLCMRCFLEPFCFLFSHSLSFLFTITECHAPNSD